MWKKQPGEDKKFENWGLKSVGTFSPLLSPSVRGDPQGQGKKLPAKSDCSALVERSVVWKDGMGKGRRTYSYSQSHVFVNSLFPSDRKPLLRGSCFFNNLVDELQNLVSITK